MGGGVIAMGEGRVADKAAAYKGDQIIFELKCVILQKRTSVGVGGISYAHN